MQIEDFGKDPFTHYPDIFSDRYYRINKRILSIVGQWPFQSRAERIVRSIGLILLGTSLLIPQMLRLIESFNQIDVFIETLSPELVNIGCTIKLFNCILNTKKLQRLLRETQDDWEHITTLPEIKILRKYAEKGRRLTIGYTTLIYSSMVLWVLTPLLPRIMDYVAPLNQSRPVFVLFQTDYKVDPEKYFYPILVHGSVVCAACVLIIVALDTLYMSIAQHACAMLQILRYRLENIMQEDDDMSIILSPKPREDVHYQHIVPCIKKHKRIIEYIKLMESTCEWCLLFVLGISLLIMSCTGSRTVAKNTSTQDALRFAFLLVAQVVHLFCNTLPGHWIMESSALVRDSAYNCRWYMMSLRSRKLILLLIRRTIDPCTINAGKIYVMSMDNFCAVLQTSMSYFTLLTSMQ